MRPSAFYDRRGAANAHEGGEIAGQSRDLQRAICQRIGRDIGQQTQTQHRYGAQEELVSEHVL